LRRRTRLTGPLRIVRLRFCFGGMEYATTLHGHPATVHTKIIRNFPVVGHFEYGDVRPVLPTSSDPDAFFPAAAHKPR